MSNDEATPEEALTGLLAWLGAVREQHPGLADTAARLAADLEAFEAHYAKLGELRAVLAQPDPGVDALIAAGGDLIAAAVDFAGHQRASLSTRLDELGRQVAAAAADADAMSALCAELAKADELWRQGDADDDDPVDDDEPVDDPELAHPQREAVVMALGAVIEFLQRHSGSDATPRRPLLHLLAALADIDNGKHSDLLKPRRVPGRNRRATMDDHRWAVAAAAVTLLIDGRVPELEACRRAAAAAGIDDPRALQRWRKYLKDRPAGVQRTYRDALNLAGGETFSQEDAIGPRLAAENLLGALGRT